jgi:hypothetical protein
MIAVIGTSEIFKSSNYSLSGNAGNMLHAQAARNLFPVWKNYPMGRLWSEEEIETLQDSYSHILVVAANGVRLARKDSDVANQQFMMARNIEMAKLPVIVLGLGTQAPDQNINDLTIPKNTEYFLSVLSSHSINIGVRGEFTAEVLLQLGIKNTEILGCQSCFYHQDINYPQKLNLALSDIEAYQIAFNYTAPMKERYLLKMAIENYYGLLGQEEFYEYCLKHLPGIPYSLSMLPRFIRTRNALQNINISETQYKNYLIDHFYQFDNLHEWLSHMKKYSFSFGTRFHGNMVALQAGIPSVWIAHDTRTVELCTHLGLPYITFSEAEKVRHINDILERCDYALFERKYKENYIRLYDFLNTNDIEHNLVIN